MSKSQSLIGELVAIEDTSGRNWLTGVIVAERWPSPEEVVRDLRDATVSIVWTTFYGDEGHQWQREAETGNVREHFNRATIIKTYIPGVKKMLMVMESRGG